MHLHIFNKRVNEVKDYEKKQNLYLEILEVKYLYSSDLRLWNNFGIKNSKNVKL